MLSARPTRSEDLAFVLAAERSPENAGLVLQWSHDQHARALEDRDLEHWILEADGPPRAVGYVILAGLAEPHRNVELKRIVVVDKGRGYGRAAVGLVRAEAFGRLGAHRLWLDVMEHNHRARALYESEGFQVEGLLRDRLLVDGRFVSIFVMAMLEPSAPRGDV